MNTSLDNKKIALRLALGLPIVLLASCRLVITTDAGGHIESASGQYSCDESKCVFPITEEVTETFTAVPAAGYRFVRWTTICTSSPTTVCTATLAPLPEEHKDSEGDIGLRADFEPVTSVRAWYRDADGDLYGRDSASVMSAEQPEGYVIQGGDCDDYDDDVHPWHKEVEDGKDNNCNGMLDEGYVDTLFYLDSDGDRYGDPQVSLLALRKPAGYVPNKLDCDDTRESDYPGAAETLDGRDNDCDGDIDEADTTWYIDLDGDGYGRAFGAIQSLEPIPDYVTRGGDCDDDNSAIYPAAGEVFDSIDNNCDGVIDEGFVTYEFFRDVDGDGFGVPGDSLLAPRAPEGYVDNKLDNCPNDYNPDQSDSDEDGIGDACDSVDNPAPAPTPTPPPTPTPTPTPPPVGGNCTVSAEAQAMLDAVNSFRSQRRTCGARGSFNAAPALAWNCKLESAALGHSMDMANNDFFSHTGSNGSSLGTRASQAGYSWSALAENIAAGTSLSSPTAAVQAWISSDGHCANMMGASYVHMGAAKFSNAASTYGLYWTQMFGRP